MVLATLTSKGQIVIPKPIRDQLDLQPGDRLDIVLRKDGTILLCPVTEDVRSLSGALARPGRNPLTVEEMNQAIRKRVSKG